MKFLIFTAAFGTGHNQVAAALAEAAVAEGHEAEVVDGLAVGVPGLSSLMTSGFIHLLHAAPGIYRMAYNRAELPGQWEALKSGGIGALTRLMWSRLQPLLALSRPDVIVCTHPFVLGVMATLRRQGRLAIPVAGVLTDFAPHSFWLHSGVDQYYVATAEMADTMSAHGVPPYRVHVTGIPIRSMFSAPPDRKLAAEALGLDPQRPTVLLMGGGLGMGPMRTLAATACRIGLPAQVLAVTGTNHRLYEQLLPLTMQADLAAPCLRVYGYVREVNHLMAVSDLLVSKAGAVTASEALAMSLPMLLVNPIAGHEERNQAALVSTQAARALFDPAVAAPVLRHLLTHPEEVAAMRLAARRAGRPQAAVQVVRHLIGLEAQSREWTA